MLHSLRDLPVFLALAILCAGASVRSLAAQGTAQFNFDGDLIQLRVITGGSAGSIEVVDGPAAELRVSQRGGGADAFFDLNGEVLSIESRSGAASDFLVRVPPTTRAVLWVNGRTVLAVAPAAGDRRASWSWHGDGAAPAEGARVPPATNHVEQPLQNGQAQSAENQTGPRVAPERPPKHTFSVHAFGGELVVDSVDVWEPRKITSLKIIVGGDRFRVYGDRSVRFGWYDKFRWGVIAPYAQGVEITVELPDDPDLFQVKMDGMLIWKHVAGEGRPYCEPLAELTRRDGRAVWVFTPIDGELTCRQPAEGPQPA